MIHLQTRFLNHRCMPQESMAWPALHWWGKWPMLCLMAERQPAPRARAEHLKRAWPERVGHRREMWIPSAETTWVNSLAREVAIQAAPHRAAFSITRLSI